MLITSCPSETETRPRYYCNYTKNQRESDYQSETVRAGRRIIVGCIMHWRSVGHQILPRLAFMARERESCASLQDDSYGWIVVNKSIETNTNTVAAKEKYAVFTMTSASTWSFVMTLSCRSPDNLAANEHGVGWSKLPYARIDFFETLSERFYTEFLIFWQRLSQTNQSETYLLQ